MKQLIFCLVALWSLPAFSQAKTSDSLLIEKTALNYIEGFYTNDAKRMESAVHPELAKRIISSDGQGNFAVRNMGASELIWNTKKFKKEEDKTKEPFAAKVVIFDISNDIASVKVLQNKMQFFDYLHLARINGDWKIINVLWARTQ